MELLTSTAVVAAILAAVVGSVVTFLFSRLSAKIDKNQKDARDAAEARKQHEKDIIGRIEQLEVITRTLVDNEQERAARQEELISMFELMQERMSHISDGVTANLRDRIVQSCTYYIEKQGWIPISVYENIEKMYDAYRALGGNGVCTKVFHEVSQLPNAPTEVA